MTPTRRGLLAWGGLAAVPLAAPALLAGGAAQVIEMRGTSRGERVWFSPIGLAVAPGATLRFVNRDKGNSHTATAYHPDILDRPRRIPQGARPWDSGFLLPEESFEVALTEPGVYDYYCQPHEFGGMVGRVVVGGPGADDLRPLAEADGDLPEAALTAFPAVETILRKRRIFAERQA